MGHYLVCVTYTTYTQTESTYLGCGIVPWLLWQHMQENRKYSCYESIDKHEASTDLDLRPKAGQLKIETNDLL